MSTRNDPEHRQPLLHVALVLAGGPLCVPGLLVGAALTKDLSLGGAMLAAAVGCLGVTLYAGCTGALGARTGRSTGELLYGVFGPLGARIVAGAIGVCLAGWYAIQTGFFGRTVHALFPEGGLLTSVEGAALWGGLLMLISALFGFRGLARLSVVAVPLIVLLTLTAVVKVAWAPDLWAEKPPRPGAFGAAVTMVFGSFAIGATVNPDMTRFCRSTAHAWIATVVSFFFVSMYIFGCGAVTSLATGSGDLITAMVGLGLGAFAFTTLVLSQWTTNDNNIFYATTSLGSVLPGVKRATLVLIFGGVATLAGVLGLADGFEGFLLWLGVLIPPIGGVMIAHHALDHCRGVHSTAAVTVPLPAVTGLLMGAMIGGTLEWGSSAVNSIVAAAAVYTLLRAVLKGQYAAEPPQVR